jgi:hypothetical protein
MAGYVKIHPIMMYVLEALNLVVYLAIVVIFIRMYFRTRDVGFLWLGVAVIVWPYVSGLLQAGERSITDRLLHQEPVGVYPFTLVERGQMTMGTLIASLSYGHLLIGHGLMLTALVYLSRARNNTNNTPKATSPEIQPMAHRADQIMSTLVFDSPASRGKAQGMTCRSQTEQYFNTHTSRYPASFGRYRWTVIAKVGMDYDVSVLLDRLRPVLFSCNHASTKSRRSSSEVLARPVLTSRLLIAPIAS